MKKKTYDELLVEILEIVVLANEGRFARLEEGQLVVTGDCIQAEI